MLPGNKNAITNSYLRATKGGEKQKYECYTSQAKNKDGSTTLRLDIYNNGERSVETLKHLKLVKPANLMDWEQNKEHLQQGQEIAVARAAELEANNYSMVSNAGKKTIVTVWMQSYV